MATVNITIDNRLALEKLGRLEEKLEDTTPLFLAIAEVLEVETEWNFLSQGRPRWVPLAESTKKSRLKQNKYEGRMSMLAILQASGILRRNISSGYGRDYALIGTNVPYAPVHQFGATIHHPTRQSTTRLATNKDGTLKKQSGNSNLAVFARRGQNARTVQGQTKAYDVTIPARPYLPFFGDSENARLQPEAEQSILETIDRWLNGSMTS